MLLQKVSAVLEFILSEMSEYIVREVTSPKFTMVGYHSIFI